MMIAEQFLKAMEKRKPVFYMRDNAIEKSVSFLTMKKTDLCRYVA